MSDLAAKRKRRQAGFSLVEILVALALIAMVVAIVATNATAWLGRGQEKTTKIQMGQIAVALNLFRVEEGRYPTRDEGLAALVKAPSGATGWNGPYLQAEAVPLDPWGQPYDYDLATGTALGFMLVSTGPDGRASDDDIAHRP